MCEARGVQVPDTFKQLIEDVPSRRLIKPTGVGDVVKQRPVGGHLEENVLERIAVLLSSLTVLDHVHDSLVLDLGQHVDFDPAEFRSLFTGVEDLHGVFVARVVLRNFDLGACADAERRSDLEDVVGWQLSSGSRRGTCCRRCL